MSLRIVNRRLVGHELDLRLLDTMEAERVVVSGVFATPRLLDFDIGLLVEGRKLSGHEVEIVRLDEMEGEEVRVDRVSYVLDGCPGEDDEEYDEDDFDLDDLDMGT